MHSRGCFVSRLQSMLFNAEVCLGRRLSLLKCGPVRRGVSARCAVVTHAAPSPHTIRGARLGSARSRSDQWICASLGYPFAACVVCTMSALRARLSCGCCRMSEEVPVAAALFDYAAQSGEELTIRKGERLYIIDDGNNWWKVLNEQNQCGLVPSNFIQRKCGGKDRRNFLDKIAGKFKTISLSPPKNDANSSVNVDGEPLLKGATKIVGVYVAKFKYMPLREDEIELNKGDRVLVYEKGSDGWWRGEVGGRLGWFPYNYVSQPSSPVPGSPVRTVEAEPGDQRTSVIARVQAVYNFSPRSEEELGFERDAILDIIDQPKDDPDWWRARNSSGAVGLVPRNHLRVIDDHVTLPLVPTISSQRPVTPGRGFETQEWYHGALSRQDCERLLANYGSPGEFMIRDSETKSGSYSLSVKAAGKVKHFHISVDSGQYRVSNNVFSSLEEVARYFQDNPVVTSSGEEIMLVKAFSKAITNQNGGGNIRLAALSE